MDLGHSGLLSDGFMRYFLGWVGDVNLFPFHSFMWIYYINPPNYPRPLVTFDQALVVSRLSLPVTLTTCHGVVVLPNMQRN